MRVMVVGGFCKSGQGVSSWSAHGLGMGLGVFGKRGGLSGRGGGPGVLGLDWGQS